MGVYKLQLLGAFVLSAPDGRVIPVTSEKARALIALVALAPGGTRSRSKLCEFLWDSDLYPDSRANLRRELSNLRAGLTKANSEELLVTDNSTVMLALDRVAVDVLDLGSGHLPARQAHGEFLEGIDVAGSEDFEDWLRMQRQIIASQIEETLSSPEPQTPHHSTMSSAAEAGQSGEGAPDAPPASLPPKPSLAVLPFAVLSEDHPQWWGISMYETVAAKLSGFPQLLVGSTNAAAKASRDLTESREIARKIGVAYLVEGSIIPDALGVKVVVKLINGATNEQVWTRIFQTDLKESGGPEDRIHSAIAHALWTAIDTHERSKFVRMVSPPQSNYERYWVANSLYRTWQAPDIARAAEISSDLVNNDPGCPWANSLAAFCAAWAWLFQALPDRDKLREKALQYVATARATGPDNVETLGYCAAALAIVDDDLDLADRIIAYSLQILPDHQPTLFWGGWIDIARSDPARGRHRFQRSLQVNPDSGARPIALCGMGATCLMEDDPSAAVTHFEEALIADPTSPIASIGKSMASSYAAMPDATVPTPASWSEAITMLSSYLARAQA